MKHLTLAVFGAAALMATAGAAFAAPAAGLSKAFGGEAGVSSGVIQVHGRHGYCALGPGGWHRTPARGVRIACRPPRPRGAFWIWKHDGPRAGWYHRRDRHWSR
ncbi:MAG: hypothetical protein JNM89_13985 [Hyphomicrobiaceae bacterium]|nr:hypothetical protein [Hyphomicrobiaceae bacterium]